MPRFERALDIVVVHVAYDIPGSARLISSCESAENDVSLLVYVPDSRDNNDARYSRARFAQEIDGFPDVTAIPSPHNSPLSDLWNAGVERAYAGGADVVILATDTVEFAPCDIDTLAKKAYFYRNRRFAVSAMGHREMTRGKYSWWHQRDMGYKAIALNPLALEKIGILGRNFFSTQQIAGDYGKRASLVDAFRKSPRLVCPGTDTRLYAAKAGAR